MKHNIKRVKPFPSAPAAIEFTLFDRGDAFKNHFGMDAGQFSAAIKVHQESNFDCRGHGDWQADVTFYDTPERTRSMFGYAADQEYISAETHAAVLRELEQSDYLFGIICHAKRYFTDQIAAVKIEDGKPVFLILITRNFVKSFSGDDFRTTSANGAPFKGKVKVAGQLRAGTIEVSHNWRTATI